MSPADDRVECAVYEMELDESYKVTKMSAMLCGDKLANTDEFNACNKENISQPDNLAYVPGHDGLIIGVMSFLSSGLQSAQPDCTT
jgi:hypothetical protein